MRHIDVKVVVGDKVVMTAPNGDDGKRTADQVWNDLPKIRFRTADGFKLHETIKDGKTVYEIRSDGLFYVEFGGQYEFKKLTFLLDETATDSERWIIDPEFIRRTFKIRLIRRRDAEGLESISR